MAVEFGIAIPAFRRPASLERLLRSLAAAADAASHYPPLIISVDHEDSRSCEECADIAARFVWRGDKLVIRHPDHLGLKANVLFCGALAQRWGAVLVLEEDLCVAPHAFAYVAAALERYGHDERVSSISLYAMIYNEFARIPFIPVDDGSDGYFAMTGSSWGQVWTRDRWAEFETWLAQPPPEENVPLPQAVERWSELSSWKRAYNRFLADRGRYVLYPRHSLSTCMGDQGQHHRQNTTFLTSPLSLGRRRFHFGELENATARYDAFLDIEASSLKRVVPALREVEFDVDLTGSKQPHKFRSPHVLSIRAPSAPVLLSFGLRHYPPELNVVFGETGTGIGLYDRQHLSDGVEPAAVRRLRTFYYQPDASDLLVSSLIRKLESPCRLED